jgi:hypothetical protein
LIVAGGTNFLFRCALIADGYRVYASRLFVGFLKKTANKSGMIASVSTAATTAIGRLMAMLMIFMRCSNAIPFHQPTNSWLNTAPAMIVPFSFRY